MFHVCVSNVTLHGASEKVCTLEPVQGGLRVGGLGGGGGGQEAGSVCPPLVDIVV